MTDLFREERLLIDGELIEATGGRTYENINPATEEVIGVAAAASAEDLDRAIAAARRAFDETNWSTDHEFRVRCLRQLHQALLENVEALRPACVAEVGCPIQFTYGPGLDVPIKNVAEYADFLESYDGWTEEISVKDPYGFGDSRRWIEREAIGVVGAIAPWNFPYESNLKKICWPLAAGCTVVLKSAPQTPWSALTLGKFIKENSDIPPGVVNIITSPDAAIGEQLTTDPRVDMISFTGSTAVGKRIIEVTAPLVTRVTTELGGKSPWVFLEDTPDLVESAAQAGAGICFHSGQGCVVLSRILVPKNTLDDVAAAVKVAMANVPVGDPMDMQTIQGPQCSEVQRQRVLDLIQVGVKDQRSTLICGGGKLKAMNKGYFVEPTAFVCGPEATVAQEEFFGPVVCIIGYEDEEDAIRIANHSVYGLGANVSSADPERAKRVARRIRAGSIGINGGVWYGTEIPFGGYKHSGLGRENGVAGFEEHLEIKALAIPAQYEQ